MPKKVSKKESAEQKFYHKTWVRLFFAAVFLALAYGFVSLAIDDGNLLQWALGIFFACWSINNLVRATAQLFKH